MWLRIRCLIIKELLAIWRDPKTRFIVLAPPVIQMVIFAHAATQEALSGYERTMLLALEETENALVTYREQQDRLIKLTDEVRESARAAGIARVRYREGVADFLSLLDAERTELQAEDSAAQAEADVFTAVVGLYRAVGGLK